MGSDPLRTLRLLILLGSTGGGSAADFLLASRLTTPVWENNQTHTRSTRRRSLRVQIPIGPPVSHRDVRGPSGSALKGPIPVDIVLSFIGIWVLVQKHKAQQPKKHLENSDSLQSYGCNPSKSKAVLEGSVMYE